MSSLHRKIRNTLDCIIHLTSVIFPFYAQPLSTRTRNQKIDGSLPFLIAFLTQVLPALSCQLPPGYIRISTHPCIPYCSFLRRASFRPFRYLGDYLMLLLCSISSISMTSA